MSSDKDDRLLKWFLGGAYLAGMRQNNSLIIDQMNRKIFDKIQDHWQHEFSFPDYSVFCNISADIINRFPDYFMKRDDATRMKFTEKAQSEAVKFLESIDVSVLCQWIDLSFFVKFNADESIQLNEYENRPLNSLIIRLMEIVHKYFQGNEDRLAKEFVDWHAKSDSWSNQTVDANSYYQLVFRDPAKPTMKKPVLIRMLQLLDAMEKAIVEEEFPASSNGAKNKTSVMDQKKQAVVHQNKDVEENKNNSHSDESDQENSNPEDHDDASSSDSNDNNDDDDNNVIWTWKKCILLTLHNLHARDHSIPVDQVVNRCLELNKKFKLKSHSTDEPGVSITRELGRFSSGRLDSVLWTREKSADGSVMKYDYRLTKKGYKEAKKVATIFAHQYDELYQLDDSDDSSSSEQEEDSEEYKEDEHENNSTSEEGDAEVDMKDFYVDAFQIMFEVMASKSNQPSTAADVEASCQQYCRNSSKYAEWKAYRFKKFLWNGPLGMRFRQFLKAKDASIKQSYSDSRAPCYLLKYNVQEPVDHSKPINNNTDNVKRKIDQTNDNNKRVKSDVDVNQKNERSVESFAALLSSPEFKQLEFERFTQWQEIDKQYEIKRIELYKRMTNQP